jgi:hypothetical protein
MNSGDFYFPSLRNSHAIPPIYGPKLATLT